MNRGLEVFGATIAATGTGSLTLAGTGSLDASDHFNVGVSLFLAEVSAANGDVSITGNGGVGVNFNEGVRIQDSNIRAGGVSNTWGLANGGTEGVFNIGVTIYLNSTVVGGAGSSISGTGGGGTMFNHGVSMGPGITSNLPLNAVNGTAGTGEYSENRVGSLFP